MPAIELTPSSIFLVTSLSTISGEAPGYSVITTTTGKSMLGNWSTCSRWYENRPSTTSASISMVAKTGFFRLTRVNHMAVRRSGRPCGSGCEAPRRTAVPSRSGPTLPATTTAPSSMPLHRDQRLAIDLAARAGLRPGGARCVPRSPSAHRARACRCAPPTAAAPAPRCGPTSSVPCANRPWRKPVAAVQPQVDQHAAAAGLRARVDAHHAGAHAALGACGSSRRCLRSAASRAGPPAPRPSRPRTAWPRPRCGSGRPPRSPARRRATRSPGLRQALRHLAGDRAAQHGVVQRLARHLHRRQRRAVRGSAPR